jgi:hypothetical protein
MRCRTCLSDVFYRSRIHFRDVLLLPLMCRPFRCRRCNRRCYGWVWYHADDPHRKIHRDIEPHGEVDPDDEDWDSTHAHPG